DGERSLVALLRTLWAAIRAGDVPHIDDHVFLERVARHEKTLVKAWQPGPAEPPLKVWLDPATGSALPNPWVTKDPEAQAFLLIHDPKLAAHFRAMAKRPYQTVAAMRTEAAKRELLSGLTYDEEVHATNVFRGIDQTKIGKFIESHEPCIVEV